MRIAEGSQPQILAEIEIRSPSICKPRDSQKANSRPWSIRRIAPGFTWYFPSNLLRKRPHRILRQLRRVKRRRRQPTQLPRDLLRAHPPQCLNAVPFHFLRQHRSARNCCRASSAQNLASRTTPSSIITASRSTSPHTGLLAPQQPPSPPPTPPHSAAAENAPTKFR